MPAFSLLRLVRGGGAALALTFLCGCSTMISGVEQEIVVNTDPPGATCTLTRQGMEVVRVRETPQTITIEKSKHPLVVKCQRDGFHDASHVLASGADKWASSNYYMVGVGFLTRAVDSATGADNNYDAVLSLKMTPDTGGRRLIVRESAPPSASASTNEPEGDVSEMAVATGTGLGETAYGDVGAVDLGNYHALIIGIDNYKSLPKLGTAAADARAVGAVLADDYGYHVTVVLDPDRDRIVDALDGYVERLGENDNLLIYYAGHGWLEESSDRGYWLPVDARPDRRSRWLSNAEIADTLKSIKAKHVMVVADSCFAGTLTRNAHMGVRDPDYLKRISSKRARVVLTSGGLEPVADSQGGGHSPFAAAFLAALKDNDGLMDGTQLFGTLRRSVVLHSAQTPEYADARDAGHEGGDFLFLKTKSGS